jgi:hypothetical protein
MALLLPRHAWSNNRSRPGEADSIMHLVAINGVKYRNILKNYEAEVYIKGRMKIEKSNYLIRFAHNLFPVNRREGDMVFEMLSLSRFEAPNSFYHDYQALNGSSIPNRQKQREIISFLNLNVYAPTAFDNAILMPVMQQAFKYYEYSVDSVIVGSNGQRTFVVNFIPKHASPKLASGTMHVADSSWTIAKINLRGHYDFSDFDLEMSFGNDFEHFNLPSTATLSLKYSMLGNVVYSSYLSKYTYKSVLRGWDQLYLNTPQTESYDLTQYYTPTAESVPIIKDRQFWNNVRSEPLSYEENKLYEDSQQKESERTKAPVDSLPGNPYLKFAELIVSDINADYKNTYIRYYGILNPSQLGYSRTNGIMFRQRLRIRKEYPNQRMLTFIPDAGFATRRKEVFLRGVGIFEYSPEKMGAITLSVGNSNQSYSTGMMKDIVNQIADTSLVEDIKLQYFHRYYGEAKHHIELFNGFRLSTEAVYEYRTPIRRRFDIGVGDAVMEIINKDYNDFKITLGFSYTPHSYYRFDKRRKIYLYSNYPTFSIEFAKAFPGVWGSVGNYERIEADVHQSIPVGLLQKINYHVSAGMYSSKQSSYFADFRYFARSNFPDTWNDQIGGVFNLLEREWFYASDRYVQAHLMYESPFMLFSRLSKKASRFVFVERLYFSQLHTPALPVYSEVGYGIGNHIFDIALFASFSKLSYRNLGLRFAFALR